MATVAHQHIHNRNPTIKRVKQFSHSVYSRFVHRQFFVFFLFSSCFQFFRATLRPKVDDGSRTWNVKLLTLNDSCSTSIHSTVSYSFYYIWDTEKIYISSELKTYRMKWGTESVRAAKVAAAVEVVEQQNQIIKRKKKQQPNIYFLITHKTTICLRRTVTTNWSEWLA